MKKIVLIVIVGSLLNSLKSHCPTSSDAIFDIQKKHNNKYHQRGYTNKVKRQQNKCKGKSYNLDYAAFIVGNVISNHPETY